MTLTHSTFKRCPAILGGGNSSASSAALLMLSIAAAQDVQTTPEATTAATAEPAAVTEVAPSSASPNDVSSSDEPSNAYCLLCHSQPGHDLDAAERRNPLADGRSASAGRFGSRHAQRARRAELCRLPHQHDASRISPTPRRASANFSLSATPPARTAMKTRQHAQQDSVHERGAPIGDA